MATLELILYCTVVFVAMVGLICSFAFGLICIGVIASRASSVPMEKGKPNERITFALDYSYCVYGWLYALRSADCERRKERQWITHLKG